MGVTYIPRINAYSANIKGKQFVYSVNKHGPMAKKLAEKSLSDVKRHQHIFEHEDGYYVMKVFHAPSDTVYDVLISEDDYNKVEPYKWCINTPENARTLYVANDKLGKLHRYLMEAPNNLIVDHINRNGLDNRKENLRLTTPSMNSRNMDVKACNKLGYNGVSYEPASGRSGPRYKVHWMDDNNRFRSKSFSVNKYPNALEMAISFRKAMEEQYGYNAS